MIDAGARPRKRFFLSGLSVCCNFVVYALNVVFSDDIVVIMGRRDFSPSAVAVIASIRHEDTTYEDLLMLGGGVGSRPGTKVNVIRSMPPSSSGCRSVDESTNASQACTRRQRTCHRATAAAWRNARYSNAGWPSRRRSSARGPPPGTGFAVRGGPCTPPRRSAAARPGTATRARSPRARGCWRRTQTRAMPAHGCPAGPGSRSYQLYRSQLRAEQEHRRPLAAPQPRRPSRAAAAPGTRSGET